MGQQDEEDDEGGNGQRSHDGRKILVVLLVVTPVSQCHFLRQRDRSQFFLDDAGQGSHIHIPAHIGHHRNRIDSVPADQLPVFHRGHDFCHLTQRHLRTSQHRNQFVFQVGETGTVGFLAFQGYRNVIIAFPHVGHLQSVAVAHGQRSFQLGVLDAQA